MLGVLIYNILNHCLHGIGNMLILIVCRNEIRSVEKRNLRYPKVIRLIENRERAILRCLKDVTCHIIDWSRFVHDALVSNLGITVEIVKNCRKCLSVSCQLQEFIFDSIRRNSQLSPNGLDTNRDAEMIQNQ